MIIAKNISGGKLVTILNDMPPKNKIRNDTSLSHLFKDSSGSRGCNLNCVKACS